LNNIPEDRRIYIKASLIQHKTVEKDFKEWMALEKTKVFMMDDPTAVERDFPEYKI